MGGGETQNRTGDTRIFSPLLYRLSYFAVPMVKPRRNLNQRIEIGSIAKEISRKILGFKLYPV